MKILMCFGTRPEAIKMSTLYHSLKKENIETYLCVTAQHREMLDQVLDFFQINPDYDLDIMKNNQSLNLLTSNIFLKIDKVLEELKPDLVLVHGDTTTSSICAWASFHRNIKVGHVEAGLRTYNIKNPFPEELNRQITGRIADYHFAPTKTAKENLIKENINNDTIIVSGNTVIDSLFWTLDKIENNYSNEKIDFLKNKIDFSKKLILVTGHRRENFGQSFENICNALIEIAKKKKVEIIFPVHLNPNINLPARKKLSDISNIHLIEPLGYPEFVWLMKNSYLILTDSGGIQEEAPSLGIPVLVMRDTTERPEAVEAGTVKMIGTDEKNIVETVTELLMNKETYNKMSKTTNPYGNGNAVEIIIDFIKTKCK